MSTGMLTSLRPEDLQCFVRRQLESRSPPTLLTAGDWNPSPSHMLPSVLSRIAQHPRSCTGQVMVHCTEGQESFPLIEHPRPSVLYLY